MVTIAMEYWIIVNIEKNLIFEIAKKFFALAICECSVDLLVPNEVPLS